MKKLIYIVVGIVSVCLGIAGFFVPFMPIFPFFLLSAFCFVRSSKRFTNWFCGTKFYKKNFETFAQGKGMSVKTKTFVVSLVTLAMGTGFFISWAKGLLIGSIVIAVVWACHVVCFIFVVKTYKEDV